MVGSLLAGSAAAQGQERWAAAERAPRATIPLSAQATTITGAALSCARQEWRLELASEEIGLRVEDVARLQVDARSFEGSATSGPRGVHILLDPEVLEPLRSGIRLTVSFAGPLQGRLGVNAFALAGSRVAIDQVAASCSLPDMSAYQAVTFTPYSSHMNLGRTLRAADIEAFRTATASEPQLSVAMVSFPEGRRLFFTRLCGSSWYFGQSGCNVTGFLGTPETGEGGETEWRAAYDSEGAHVYLDSTAEREGWPMILTLPTHPPVIMRRWTFQGEGGYGVASTQ